MSRHDYTKFSNKQNYSKPVENQNGVTKVEEPILEQHVEETTEPANELIEGIVVDCLKLNVREEPSADAKVLRTIDASTELKVSEDESTDEFYKVYLADGNEGYCMRQFIKVI